MWGSLPEMVLDLNYGFQSVPSPVSVSLCVPFIDLSVSVIFYSGRGLRGAVLFC